MADTWHIKCVKTDRLGIIRKVGRVGPLGLVEDCVDKEHAARLILAGDAVYVRMKNPNVEGPKVHAVKGENGSLYLRTDQTPTEEDNLVSLPECTDC